MQLFNHGAQWVRADFHLHTNSDKEFCNEGDENFYYSSYVDALAKNEINIGVIANHNKFNFDEFEALRKTAKKKDIFLLPGVELSVGDGANGVHVIVVFSENWLEKKHNRISAFISSMFTGKAAQEYENENRCSDKSILQTVEELDKTGYDYFLIPEEVIEQIGQGRSCYVKIGAFTFDAVKFALMDYKNRYKKNKPKENHSYIKQISFEGGLLGGQIIRFSPQLNTLIGIRGSGKSSILEAIRYCIGSPLDLNDSEYRYKQELVERTLGSGGKIVIEAVDRYGQIYCISRILNENAQVFLDNKLSPSISIRETVLHKPIYFGQKEIVTSEKSSEKELIEKLIGSKCDQIRRQIEQQKSKVNAIIDKLATQNEMDERIAEETNAKNDAIHRLEFYKKHNLDEKLQKRISFDVDINKADRGCSLVESYLNDLSELLEKHEDELRNYPGHESKENAAFFNDFEVCFSKIINSVNIVKDALTESTDALDELNLKKAELIKAKSDLSDEFAAVERELVKEVKNLGGQNISTNAFLAAKDRLAKAERALAELNKSQNRKSELQNTLDEELHNLNKLWHEEFLIIKKELDVVSAINEQLRFSVKFKGDKKALADYLSLNLKGTGIRKSTVDDITESCTDFTHMYKDIISSGNLIGINHKAASNYFMNNLKDFLTYQPPNKFSITFRGIELSQHSLGQRASALILFVLGQKDNDLIIIDQPEDDLDNQTIYEDVIMLIRNMKPSVQFIFASHNPNIPVLGDAEQIHTCSFLGDNIRVESGGLDNTRQQENIIRIMEGGKEAFRRRKEIYGIWKS